MENTKANGGGKLFREKVEASLGDRNNKSVTGSSTCMEKSIGNSGSKEYEYKEAGTRKPTKTSIQQERNFPSSPVTLRAPATPNLSPTEKHQQQLQDDNASFTLFTNSFETLSDNSEHYLGPENSNHRSNDNIYETPVANNHHRQGIDLTSLSDHKHGADESDYSIGDLSPIKISYNGSDGLTDNNVTMNDERNCHGTGEDGATIHSSPDNNDGQEGGGEDPARKIHDDCGGRYDRGSHEGDSSSLSNPFFVIRASRRVFASCKYILPCLREMDMCPVHINGFGGHIRHYKSQEAGPSIPPDLKIATRRVEAAICAFGGSLNTNRLNSQAQSVFRPKGAPSARATYKQMLPSRYYLGGSKVEWEVESNPPVHVELEEENDVDSTAMSASTTSPPKTRRGTDANNATFCQFINQDSPTSTPSPSQKSLPMALFQPKMKYRCKLCGQLKQNHTCPYRHSLQRSIGVMVHAAVNSFTAAEPGIVTPALTEMNNFVSYQSEQRSPDHHELRSDSATPHLGSMEDRLSRAKANKVTPEATRTTVGAHHQDSHSGYARKLLSESKSSAFSTGGQRKRSRSQVAADEETVPPRDLNFAPTVTLRPEHYRAVTPTAAEKRSPTAYQYPAIPLPFAERKRLSDTLFYLSNEIPTMTSFCADVLREARESNEWDLAMAELLTQVVVGLYCGEGDLRLDGLHQYLLALGISC